MLNASNYTESLVNINMSIVTRVKSRLIAFFRKEIPVWLLLVLTVFYFVFDALGVMVYGYSAGVDMSSEIESITKDATGMIFVFGVAFFAFCFGNVEKRK